MNFADDDQAQGSWSIAEVGGNAFAGATFDLFVARGEIATGLALGDAIEASVSAEYAGWGFTVENDVLKFKNLA